MKNQSAVSFEDLLAELNTDPEYRKADRQIRPYYDLVTQIIHRRNDLSLTQKDLAERLGTHQSRISKIESAQHDIRLSTLISIAEALESEIFIQLIPLPPTDYKYVGEAQLFTLNSTSIPVSIGSWSMQP